MSNANDEKIGRRTRDLLRSFSEFADMLAINAPTSVLSKQLDELEKIGREIDDLAGTQIFESGMLGDMFDKNPAGLMRLYEVLQHRRASTAGSE